MNSEAIEAFGGQLARVLRSLERGDRRFVLVALVERYDLGSPPLMDLVLSAKWLRPSDARFIRRVVNAIQTALGPSALQSLAKVVIVSPTDPFVASLVKRSSTRLGRPTGVIALTSEELQALGLPLDHGYGMVLLVDKEQTARVSARESRR